MIKEIFTKTFSSSQFYEDFDIIQSDIHAEVLSKNLDGYLLFLEYKDIYTVGRFSKTKHTNNIVPIKTSRGGDITFHGKGQEVIYPIINIKKLGISLRDYLEILHNSMIKFLSSKKINAKRNYKGPGLWVDKHKVSFIGVAVKKGVTLHGISINIKCNLEKFKLISPCGDPSIKVGNLLSLADIDRKKLRDEIAAFFIDELNSYNLREKE